nr:unnamed protein product [Spirometra erinaceieuropaei]
MDLRSIYFTLPSSPPGAPYQNKVKKTGDFVAGLESILLASNLPEDRRANIRSCATGILRQKRYQQNLPAEEAQGLRSLQSDNSIAVGPPDKGGATVIMSKIKYVNKANENFSDMEAYTVLAEDPTKNQATTIKKKVNELARLNVIGPDEAKLMTLSDTHIKHASDSSPKFNIVGKHVGTATQVVEAIVNALAVETLSDLLHQNYDEGDGQPTAQDLIELMGHCLKTFFTFEGITYEQIKVTPMGSPISGLIAVAVLQKLGKRLFEEYKPKIWARYVDDTFVIIDQDKISYYEKLLNSVIPDLQLTIEEEVESKLSYMDVLICRQPDGCLACFCAILGHQTSSL